MHVVSKGFDKLLHQETIIFTFGEKRKRNRHVILFMPAILSLSPSIDFMSSFTINVTPYCVIICVFSHEIAMYTYGVGG